MKITHEFTVSRPLGTVWDFFQDVPEVAQCLPGAQLTSVNDDGSFSGRVAVKLGPMSATFDGKAAVSTDPEAHTGAIDGSGADRRGGSRGQVKVAYALVPDGASTKVTIDADVILSGAAAQFGRGGLVQEMSSRLISEFVSCVEGKLAATTPEEAAKVSAGDVHGFSLFWASLMAWLKGLFSRK